MGRSRRTCLSRRRRPDHRFSRPPGAAAGGEDQPRRCCSAARRGLAKTRFWSRSSTPSGHGISRRCRRAGDGALQRVSQGRGPAGVSEAKDLGDVDRYKFYDHMKAILAAPPDVLRVDEKNLREHDVMNVCGVVITTNYKSNGVFLPADDRRHYVAWSDLTKGDFSRATGTGCGAGTMMAASAMSPPIWRASISRTSIPKRRRRRRKRSGRSSTPIAHRKTPNWRT